MCFHPTLPISKKTSVISCRGRNKQLGRHKFDLKETKARSCNQARVPWPWRAVTLRIGVPAEGSKLG